MIRDAELLPSAPLATLEQEALRIQAAAVAAQQMATLDAECQLEQRRTTLDRQERQLAQHLESQRRQLEEQRRELQAAAAAIESERVAVARAKEQAAIEAAAADAEQRRRETAAREELDQLALMLDKRSVDLDAREIQIHRDRADLEQSRAAHRNARLRFNGEMELSRRQLEHQWAEFTEAARAADQLNEREVEQSRQRASLLDQRETELGRAATALRADQASWLSRKESLTIECEGLESRIANLREVLTLHNAAAPPPASATAVQPVAERPSSPAVPRVLNRLADDLWDQRCVLAEQWQQLLGAEVHWRQERSQVIVAIEAAAAQLAKREAELDGRQRRLDAAEASLASRQVESQKTREVLAARMARLAAAEAGWTAERDRMMVELQSRSDALTLLRGQLTRLRQCWRSRLAKERAAHHATMERLLAARRRYAELWREERKRRRHAGRDQRALATEALALEQLRHELILQAPDAAAAERRFARLLRRELAIRERDERELVRSQDSLQGESRRLDELARLLGDGERDLLARQEAVQQQQADLDERAIALSANEEKLRVDTGNWQARHALDQRLISELREEIERITHLLLDGEESVNPPIVRAA